jgi:hypothetical protein
MRYSAARSQDSVAVVEAALNPFASDGLDAFVEYCADNCHHRAIEGPPDDHGPMHGKDAVRPARHLDGVRVL